MSHEDLDILAVEIRSLRKKKLEKELAAVEVANLAVEVRKLRKKKNELDQEVKPKLGWEDAVLECARASNSFYDALDVYERILDE
jgi:hypothetical protein